MGLLEEEERVARVYDRKISAKQSAKYTPLSNYNQQVRLEINQVLGNVIRTRFLDPYHSGSLSALDFGCGNGNTILTLISLGLSPNNVTGVDVAKQRVLEARTNTPNDVEIIQGGRHVLASINKRFDMAICSLVLSSLLDRDAREQVCRGLAEVCKPGGVVVIYDFVMKGSANPAVRPVSHKEVQAAFPGKRVQCQSVTLAPPLGRFFESYPKVLAALAMIPLLRTHKLYVVTI